MHKLANVEHDSTFTLENGSALTMLAYDTRDAIPHDSRINKPVAYMAKTIRKKFDREDWWVSLSTDDHSVAVIVKSQDGAAKVDTLAKKLLEDIRLLECISKASEF